MKKFTTKVTIFIVLFLVIIISTTLVVRNFANIEIDKNNSIVVIGHSHPEVAFNNELIEGLVNYSSSGESYFYNYVKLKILLKKNPHIQIVFLEFTNNQIGIYNETWIWGNEKMLHFFPIYAAHMDIESINLLYDKNRTAFKKSIFPFIKQNFLTLGKGLDISHLGGYKILDQNLTDSINGSTIININKEIPGRNYLSLNNLEYLRKIIELCKRNNKEIYLIRSPLHEQYSGFENEKLFQELLAKDFPDLEFLDFSNFPLDNSSYGDLEHLNYKGAKKFSTWISGLIDNGLIRSNNKKEIIKAEMEFLSGRKYKIDPNYMSH